MRAWASAGASGASSGGARAAGCGAAQAGSGCSSIVSSSGAGAGRATSPESGDAVSERPHTARTTKVASRGIITTPRARQAGVGRAGAVAREKCARGNEGDRAASQARGAAQYHQPHNPPAPAPAGWSSSTGAGAACRCGSASGSMVARAARRRGRPDQIHHRRETLQPLP